MILTVTPNPMLDKTLWLDDLRFGATHRARRMATIVGGKGLNVSRALTGLGEDTLATGFLGGPTGAEIRTLLEREGIPHDFAETAAATRAGFTVVEEKSGRRTAVFEPGSQLQIAEVKELTELVERLLPRCRAMALCGSMPCAGFDGMYADLIQQAHQWQVPVFLDSYHEPLRMGLAARAQFLKPNRDEAWQTFGIDAREPGGMQKLLHLLAGYGAQCVLVTDADRPLGVMLEGKPYLATPPRIASPNPLGSGDALVAGFLYAWLHGRRELDLIRFAVAAGTINAMHDIPGYADLMEIEVCAQQVRVDALN